MQFKSFKSDAKQLAAIALALLLAGVAGSAFAYKGEQYSKQARVSLERARILALKAQAGKIVDEELEKESGGSGLRYSFAIRNGDTTHEVGVDAMSGKLLEDSKEGAHAD